MAKKFNSKQDFGSLIRKDTKDFSFTANDGEVYEFTIGTLNAKERLHIIDTIELKLKLNITELQVKTAEGLMETQEHIPYTAYHYLATESALLALVDSLGNKIFKESEYVSGRDQIGELPLDCLIALMNEIFVHNKLDNAGVNNASKNSEPIQN